MELGLFEMAFILVTVVGVLGLAFALAWRDASPPRAGDQGPD